jgi:hypothetical protein
MLPPPLLLVECPPLDEEPPPTPPLAELNFSYLGVYSRPTPTISILLSS